MLIALALSWPGSAPAGHDPAIILIYPGIGRPDAIRLVGRVLEDDGLSRPRRRGRLRNAIRLLRALDSDEIEHAVVAVTVGPHRFRAETNDDGVWRIEVSGLSPPLAIGPQVVRVTPIDDRGHPTPPAVGTVHIVPDAPSLVIVSDIDDTVVHSYVRHKARMVRTFLTKSPRDLRPVAGAAEAYRRAQAAGAAAVIYLTGSPQNLLGRITAFLAYNRFPAGALLLKNFGVGRDADPGLLSSEAYKLSRLRALLVLLPRAKLLLIGDAGEKDPEVYRALRAGAPERVAGIVIRRVPGADHSAARLAGMITLEDYREQPDLLARLIKGDP